MRLAAGYGWPPEVVGRMTLAQAHAYCDALVPDERKPKRGEREPGPGWTKVTSAAQLEEAIAAARRAAEADGATAGGTHP